MAALWGRCLDDSDATVQQRTATGLALIGQPVEPLLAEYPLATVRPRIRTCGSRAWKCWRRPRMPSRCRWRSEPLDRRTGRRSAWPPSRRSANWAIRRRFPRWPRPVDDKEPEIAREAAYALAAMNVPESIELLKTLAAKNDHPARVWIAVALHRVDPADTDARVKALMADQDRDHSSPDDLLAGRT